MGRTCREDDSTKRCGATRDASLEAPVRSIVLFYASAMETAVVMIPKSKTTKRPNSILDVWRIIRTRYAYSSSISTRATRLVCVLELVASITLHNIQYEEMMNERMSQSQEIYQGMGQFCLRVGQ